jgi:NDP-sugar pyrophosphorylase family protein
MDFRGESEPQPEEKETEPFSNVTVVINAGGQGERMLPVPGIPKEMVDEKHTRVTKALIEYAGKPIIDYHLEQLIDYFGAQDIIVNAGDHRNLVKHLQQSRWAGDTRIRVATTETQEDTGGDLIKTLRGEMQRGAHLHDETLVMNVDTLIEVDPDALMKTHRNNKEMGAAATIVLTRKMKNIPNAGAYLVGSNGKVLATREADSKYATTIPSGSEVHPMSSTGVVIFNTQELLNYPWQPGEEVSPGKPGLSIYRHVMGNLVKEGKVWAHDNGANFFWEAGTPVKHEILKRHEEKVFELGKGKII